LDTRWKSEPTWTPWRRETYVAPPGNRTLVSYFSSPYRSNYTDWAIVALVYEERLSRSLGSFCKCIASVRVLAGSNMVGVTFEKLNWTDSDRDCR
jgi:hypothetical protein